MLYILGMIILIIIFFIIILLYIGVDVKLIYDKTGSDLNGCLEILILKKIKVYSLEYPSESEDEDNEEKNEDKESNRDIKELLQLVKPCLNYFIDFLKSFLKCIKVEKLENHFIFGLESFVDTAKYIGYIWGILGIVNSSHKNIQISAEPRFNGGIFDGKGINKLNINILKLIPPIIKLILKKEVRELIKGVRNG